MLLFDLGGVLVDATGLRELPRLLAEPMQPEDLRRKWVSSAVVERFETGRCSKDEFAIAFNKEWGLRLAPDDFIARFRSWVGVPYPGTAELLSQLSSRHKLACLSNTNAVHWEQLRQMDGLRLVLDRPFVSHELGVMKPSPAIYAHVVRELGCEAGEIIFCDDGVENVEGAAKAGLCAHQTVGPAHLRKVITELGLL